MEELDSTTEEDASEVAKYELLVKRDQDMTAFIDSFDSTRAGIVQEMQQVQYVIVALLEDISKGLEDGANMPSQEAHSEMEDAKVRCYTVCVCVCMCVALSTSLSSLYLSPTVCLIAFVACGNYLVIC